MRLWPLGRASTLLLALVVALGALDWALASSRENARRAGSERLRLATVRAFQPAEAVRLDLTLAGGSGPWSYVKRDGAWRIPRYRDAFALTPNVEGIAKALVEGRGTRAGRYPAAADRFGVSARSAMKLELRDADGYLLLGALAGRVAPGERGDECFVAQEDGADVLLFDASPWSSLARSEDGRLPPLLDRRVVPSALARSSIARIAVAPPASGLSELIRREIPKDPNAADPEKGPRFEWFATFSGEGEKRVNDLEAGRYASFLGDLAFEDLAGPASSERARVGDPELTLVVHTDGGAADTLVLGAARADGRRFLHSSATDQVFLLAPESATGLAPDVPALLAPMPKAEERGG